ncbi:MAG: hypothetical protein J5784_00805 [Muribaculaceae bacterium]|nr:hypothetical protein [Muribaculaceae bacterium]
MAAITVTSATELSNIQGHLLVVSDIQLEGNLTIAAGSILEFRNGAQIICTEEVYDQNNNAIVNHFSVAFNNNTIIASDYSVFIGYSSISGSLANAEINADWFGAATAGLCTKAVNTAIGLSLNQTVVMPSRVYTINSNDISPIILDKSGTSLVCNGQINCSSSSLDCMFDLRAERINLLIHRIHRTNGQNDCSAVRISGNAYDCDIRADFITAFDKGLDFSPAFYGDAMNSGVQHCRFKWQIISCTYDIYFDFCANANNVSSQTVQYSVWFTDNYFLGGRLHGVNALYMKPTPPVLPNNYHLYTPTDCVFENVGFEKEGQVSLDLHDCENFTFKNCRISTNELRRDDESFHKFILLNNCRNIRIDNKCGFDLNRMDSTDSHNVTITNHNYSDWPMTRACALPTLPPSSDIIAYCHSETNAYNRIVMQIYSGTINHEIDFDEIFPDIGGGAKLLTKIVRLVVSGGMTLKIKCSPNQILALPDISFVCVLSGSSGIQFVCNNAIIKAAYSSMIINSHELVEL